MDLKFVHLSTFTQYNKDKEFRLFERTLFKEFFLPFIIQFLRKVLGYSTSWESRPAGKSAGHS